MTEREKALIKAGELYDRFGKNIALRVIDEIEVSDEYEHPSDVKLVFWYRVRKYIKEL